ncbi:MAG: esterase, partial [Phaeodactylibacter sp.]|nr:esterase [Phaeodactylibacter sp.]
MKHLYFLAIISLMGGSLLAQDDAQGCDGQRYFYSVFDDVTKTTVKFGENINSSGVNQELFMDVFEPLGDDLEARPTIVWAFGGAFIT